MAKKAYCVRKIQCSVLWGDKFRKGQLSQFVYNTLFNPFLYFNYVPSMINVD